MQTKANIQKQTPIKAIFTARTDGASVIVWHNTQANSYAIRSYTPTYLATDSVEWLIDALCQAHTVVQMLSRDVAADDEHTSLEEIAAQIARQKPTFYFSDRE